MKKWLKWSLAALGAGVVLVAGAGAAGWKRAESRMARSVAVDVQPVAYTADPAALERGRYLFNSRGCTDCHGAAGGGRTLIEADNGLHIAGPNLTPGNPRIAAYTELDWVRSIRHGVAPDGRPLRVMPSEDYNRLTDADLASLVAYMRQLAPERGRETGTVALPLPARVMYGFGLLDDAAEKIDHRLPPASPVPEGATVEHGRYVAQMCLGCHGPRLDGGRIPGSPPDWPAAARLSPGEGSVLPRYADAGAFAAMFKSGRRPDGSKIAVMPFESLAQMNDTDTQALFVYLKSLPAAP